MGKRDNVVQIIQRSGGEISLSALEAAYKETYGNTDVPAKLTFRDWIKTFGGIETRLCDTGDRVALKVTKSTGKRDNVVNIIQRSGGEISLSDLEAAYKQTYGDASVPAQLMFQDWIKNFGGIETRLCDTGDYIASLPPHPPLPPQPIALQSHDLNGVEKRNILKLIRASDADMSLCELQCRYEEAYGEVVTCPTKKLQEWIQTLDSIGTRKLDISNDVVIFAKASKDSNKDHTFNVSGVGNQESTDEPTDEPSDEPTDEPTDKLTDEPSDELTDEPTDELTEEPTDFLVVGEATNKSQSECEDVVQKLITYAGGQFRLPIVHQDSLSILDMLPEQWSKALSRIGMDKVSDISLDLGRRPYCWHDYQRKYLCEYSKLVRRGNLLDVFNGGQDGRDDIVVEYRDIQGIVSNLQDFGGDNRAGIDGQLHRISCIRNNTDNIIGLTIRVGRHVEGNADMIRDLLEESNKSILLLGEPGSGKTTIVRDVTKILSQRSNVFVVDTSNEIAGDGNIPHPCVGDARRMMVKSLPSQADTMIECVQNHTPSVMVIDEIGRKREVEAAQTSKNRGVRMIASAHGDLRSLMKNKDIRGLLGGLETVTLGDGEAKDLQKKTGSKTIQKQLTTRAAVPIFDTIIELKRGRLNEWHVIPDAAKAVDDVLLGKQYEIQKRLRCVNSGNIFVERIKN